MANLADSICKRTIFVDREGSVVKFHDFALVQTPIGPMLQPFQPWMRHGISSNHVAYNPTDPAARIDEIKELSIHQQNFMIGGLGGKPQGGCLLPRSNY